MKRIILLLTALPMLTMAQVKLSNEIGVKVGMEYPVIDGGTKLYVTTSQKAVSVKVAGEMAFVQTFNTETGKQESRKEYKDFPKYMKVSDLISIKDRVFFIFEGFNKKERNFSVYAREVDLSSGAFKDFKMLFTTQGEVVSTEYSENVGSWGMQMLPKFQVYRSYDDSKVLIGYKRKPVERNNDINKDIIGFWVFNSDFSPVWGTELKMPYTETEMDNIAVTVGSDGTGYMLAFIEGSKSFELLSMPEGGTLQKKGFRLGKDILFRKVYMTETVEGNLAYAGFYANGIDVKVSWGGGVSTSYNMNGVYHFETTPSGEITKENDYEFPLDFVNAYQSDFRKRQNAKREAEGKAGVEDIKFRSVETFDDGSAMIIGEQYYYRSSGGYNSTIEYWYKDVVVMKVKDSQVQWLRRLPKEQVGAKGKGGMGISYLQGEGAHYILFLDNVKNARLSINDTPERHKDGLGGYLTAYKIDDASGSVEKHTIFDSRNVKGREVHQFKTSRIFKAADGKFMVEVYMKGKKDAMIVLDTDGDS